MRLHQETLLFFGFMLMVLPSLAQENSGYKNITIQNESFKSGYTLKGYDNIIKLDEKISIIDNTISPSKIEFIKTPISGNIQTESALYNYNRSGNLPLSKSLFIHLDRDKRIYQGLASYVSIEGALGWRINDHISITGGLLAIKQFSGIRPYATGRSGVRFTLNYKVNERASLNIWSQYITSYNSTEPKFSDMLMPQTSTGASATLKIGENSQIGITTQYQEINPSVKVNYESQGTFQLKF